MRKISSLQYSIFIWFLIRACFLELTLTSILYKIKEDAPISLLLGSFFGLLLLLIFEKLKNYYPNSCLTDINEKIFKHGKIVNIILLIGLLTINISTLWILNHFANSLFLYKTNLWIISIVLIIPIAYTSSKQMHIIAKVCEILFYISVIINILIMLGLFSGIDLNNLKPFFESKKENILYCSGLFLLTNISKMFLLTVIPRNSVKNYSFKKNIVFYVLSCLNIIQITISIICIFGIDLSLLYEYPAFQILKRVNLLGVLDRLESILSIEALFSLFIELVLTTYYIKKIFKNISKKTDKYIVPFICLITYFLSNVIFKTHEAGEDFLSNQMLWIILVTCIIVPTLILFKLIKNSKVVKQKYNTTYYNGNDK